MKLLDKIKAGIRNKYNEYKADNVKFKAIAVEAKQVEKDTYFKEKRNHEIKQAKQRARDKVKGTGGGFSFLDKLAGPVNKPGEKGNSGKSVGGQPGVTFGDMFDFGAFDEAVCGKKRKKYKGRNEIDVNKLI